jgi:hypothetical protein
MKHPSLFVVAESNLSLGVCCHTPGQGWRFISHVSSHSNSRRHWPNPEAAVPQWARRQFRVTLMTAEQHRVAKQGVPA